MINIFAHRGLWNKSIKPNSSEAIVNALKQGFSIETDIRDFGGENIGISHDPILIDSKIMKIEEYIDIFNKYADQNAISALNIKSDGLEDILINHSDLINNSKFFFFDGSFPSMKRMKDKGFICFDRISEFESKSSFPFDGVWVDLFQSDWLMDIQKIDFNLYKSVVIVSSELHNRAYAKLWNWIKDNRDIFPESLGLCTDFPEEAKVFFK